MPQTPRREVIQHAVFLACRAPSIHNSQPWRWFCDDAKLHLCIDWRRWVPGADQSGWEAVLSCGAVLDHLRVAMAAAGWDAHINRCPNPDDLNRLATVEFRPLDVVTESHRGRADAILQRRTDRLALETPTQWGAFATALQRAIGEGSATLDVLADDDRPLLAEASRLTESSRRDDPSYQAELQWWTADFVTDEGITAETLLSATEQRRVDVAREFPCRAATNRRADHRADSAKIMVLSTESDRAADLLGCGEALSTVLLECTMAGVASCTLTHLIELCESRDIVRTLIGGRAEPQLLIRAGVAPLVEQRPAPTPRRPLADVLEFGEAR
jgi:nitroreductase